MTKRKVRKDFDKTQPITVDVSRVDIDVKVDVQQAFFDLGIKWRNGSSHTCFNASCYTNTNSITGEVGILLWGHLGIGITPDEFLSMVYEDEG